ncbi:MAG: hypothetical protein HZB33_14515 [Nitrospirae bacterium]|nr:hypothetical protein [Nitrospirota bacterium]
MSPEFAVFIMMNNYFHDVATAMLFATGLIMWLIVRHYNKAGNEDLGHFVLRMHRRMRGVILVSLVWITVSAIPRILTFTRFEWHTAVEKKHIIGLIAKHTVAFIILVSGAMLWIHLNRLIKALPAYKAGRDNTDLF